MARKYDILTFKKILSTYLYVPHTYLQTLTYMHIPIDTHKKRKAKFLIRQIVF